MITTTKSLLCIRVIVVIELRFFTSDRKYLLKRF